MKAIFQYLFYKSLDLFELLISLIEFRTTIIKKIYFNYIDFIALVYNF